MNNKKKIEKKTHETKNEARATNIHVEEKYT